MVEGVNVFAIDPGPQRSAWAILDNGYVVGSGIEDNGAMLDIIASRRAHYPIAIEMIASYGMPVGHEVFETVLWIGRFVQMSEPHGATLIYRKDESCTSAIHRKPKIRTSVNR